MDKIKKYQKIVEKVLEKRMGFPTEDFPNIKDILLISKDKLQFIQLTFGWIKEKYTHYPAFHIEITLEGKIYIHQNRTDVLIDELLMEQGVPEIDILDGMDETFPRKLADSKAA